MAEPIEQVQRALTAYTIERELGSGGMATVYLAHDKKHDRKVAIKILHAGGIEPQWSHSGSELFYRDGARNLLAVEVKTTPTFSLGRSTTLFPAAEFSAFELSPQYAVAPDDRRFLMIRPLGSGTPDKLIVVENWFEEFKAKSRR